MAKAKANILVEEMQLGMAGAVMENEGVEEEAVTAERKDSGRP